MSVLVLFSGGIDSTVLAYQCRANGNKVSCLHVNYGSKHDASERIAAWRIANRECFPLEYLNLPLVLPGNALTDRSVAVPHGHYADPVQRATVVPNRNAVLLSVAVAYAVARGINSVAYGAHAGDAAIYPDCRSVFVDAYNRMLVEAGVNCLVLAPFLGMTKADIVRRGRELQVPLELTWSCYEGRQEPCGKCGACVERREAMESA